MIDGFEHFESDQKLLTFVSLFIAPHQTQETALRLSEGVKVTIKREAALFQRLLNFRLIGAAKCFRKTFLKFGGVGEYGL
ncbi:hypothetical protein E3A20_09570 [Planctomyces bekefii]|uniref:Uncharacterized protein n=1 Tax=Planctomyces bekefii TaxID=1653850 RepID=A0A5C6M536_9PLAN|nr:hypothetical protein E3A20_09570 [Planctomyces bekefii]